MYEIDIRCRHDQRGRDDVTKAIGARKLPEFAGHLVDGPCRFTRNLIVREALPLKKDQRSVAVGADLCLSISDVVARASQTQLPDGLVRLDFFLDQPLDRHRPRIRLEARGSVTDEVSAGHQPDEQADAQNRHPQESHRTAPPRRTARTPPARTRMTTTATPTLRVLDIGVRGRDGSRGHGAEATDLQVHATVELLALLARVVP